MDDVTQQPVPDVSPTRRVLLVDADDGGRDMTRGLLKLALQKQVEITESGDLEEAIALIESRCSSDRTPMFDCVMIDCDLDGVQVPESLHRIADACGGELPCPIIVLNGSDGATKAEAVFGAGAQDRIAKQWLSPPFLRRVLENAVERFAMEKIAREQAEELEEANARLQEVNAQLVEATQRVRRAGEAARIGHWRIDPATDTAEVDDVGAALFGLPREAFAEPGRGFEAMHPDDREQVRAALERAAGEDRYEAEFRVVLPDGKHRWLAGRGDAVRDDAGNVIAFTGVNWDITARRVAEAETDERIRQVIDNTPTFVGIVDVEGRLQEVNRSALEAGGLTRGDVIDKPFWDAPWWTHDAAEVRRLRDSVDAALRGEAVRYDAVVRMAGDTRMTIDFSLVPVRDDSGTVTHLIPSGVDVTDRVTAERQRTLALEAADMGTWEVELPSQRVTWDKRCRELFGLADRQDVSMGDAVENIHPEDRPRIERAIAEALDPATGGEYDVEYRVAAPGEPVRWIHVTGRATFRDDAEAEHGRVGDRFFGVIVNVTDRVETELQRRFSLEAAEMGTWEINLADDAVRWDERCGELLGLDDDSIAFGEAFEKVHADDRDRVREAIERALNPDDPAEYDVEYRVTPGGEVRWVRSVGRADFRTDADGRRTGERLHGVIMDVTRRREDVEKLAEREAFNRALMEGSPDCVKVLDLEGRVLHMNGHGIEMMGYGTLGDVVGRSYADCYEGEHRERVEKCIARAADGETARVEAHGTTAKGEVRWWDVTVSPVRSEGEAIPRLLCISRDVTDRREQQEAARERELRLQQALDAGEMGSFVWNIEADDPHPDDRMMTLFGVSERRDMSLAEVMKKRVHPDDRDAHGAAVEAALDPAGDGLFDVELRIIRSDGEERRIRIQGRTQFGGEPLRATRMVGLAVDVTDRREQEEALRASRERLALGTAVGGLGLIEFDYARDRCRLDDRAAELFGVGEAGCELARGELHDTFHPEDLPELRRRIEACVDPNGDGTFEMDHRVVSPGDGSVRWLRVNKQVFFEGEGELRRPARAMLAALDITEQRQAEENLRRSERELSSLAANTPDVISRFDRGLRHLFVNDAVTKASGEQPEWFIGKRTDEIGMPPEITAEFSDLLRRVFDTGETHSYAFVYQTPDGERHFEVTLVPERNGDESIATVLTVTRDATHRRRAEQQLRQSIEEAERANAAKDHFLAVLSHELRTPLTPVLAAAGELANRRDLPDDVREDLAMIRRNVELEARLMDDMLDLTRVSRGKLEINFAAVDVHENVRRVFEMVAAEAEGKQVTIRINADAQHRHISGDSARLQQILWNLLKNAVKFTPTGGTVSVRTENVADAQANGDAGGRLRVTVTDTGEGITADLLPKIFDAFEQGEASVTRQFGGLGLGLAITKVLVDLHGGTIAASSPGRGQGATFVVEFPTTPAPETPAADRADPARGSKLRVLLVEDHRDTARLMARLLRSRGMSVKTADTVAAALRTVTSEPFDVIVSDLGLPDGSGHDFLRQARSAGVAAPAIVLSGFGSDRDREQSESAGFAEHLTKPIDFDQLVAAVRRVAMRQPSVAT